MEKAQIKKNILFGCVFFTVVLPICLLITGKDDFTKDEKRIFVTSLIAAALAAILASIPFIGWIAEIPLVVFVVIAIVNYFKGNLDYKMILVSKMAYWFIKD